MLRWTEKVDRVGSCGCANPQRLSNRSPREYFDEKRGLGDLDRLRLECDRLSEVLRRVWRERREIEASQVAVSIHERLDRSPVLGQLDDGDGVALPRPRARYAVRDVREHLLLWHDEDFEDELGDDVGPSALR